MMKTPPFLKSLFAAWLASPLKWSLVLGIGLFLPALGGGFYIDDWFHRALVEDLLPLPKRHALDLFHFVSNDESYPVVGSFVPWWSGDSFRASFFRPVSALSHVLDAKLFGTWAAGYHAASLLYWGLLIGAVVRFHRRLARLITELGGGGETLSLAVGLAALIFAVDDCHSWNVAWLANRNALLASLFVVLGLQAYLEFRRGGGLPQLGLTLLCAALALGSSELGVALLLGAFAYELSIAQGRWSRRLGALAPLVLLTGIYLVYWKAGGYGTRGSGLYLDPFAEPLAFVQTGLGLRFPMLLLGLITPIAPDIAFLHPWESVDWLLAGTGWSVFFVMFWALGPLFRRDPTARWMALFILFALVPVCATFPHGRLLLLPTVASSWLLGRYLAFGLARRPVKSEGPASSVETPGRKLLVPAFGLTHIVLAPLVGVVSVLAFFMLGSASNTVAREAEIPVGDEAYVLGLNSPDPFSPTYLPLVRAGEGLPMPSGFWSISIVPAEQTLVRTGPDRFTLEVGSPGFGATDWEQLFRRGLNFVEGERFVRGHLEVRADRVVDGELRRIEVQLDRSLDEPGVALVAWDGKKLAPVELPRQGECISLPAPQSLPALPQVERSRPEAICEAQVRFGKMGQQSPPSPPPPRENGLCRLELSTGGPWVERLAFSCPEEGPLRLILAGDFGRPGPIVEATGRAIQSECDREPCHLMLLPGDLLYGAGWKAEENWEGAWTRGLARAGLPALAVLGNHGYRHEPMSELRRAHLYAQDGKAGFVLPAPSYAARVRRGEDTILAVGALDTDSVANPGPTMPGLGIERLEQACKEGAPTIALGHHPAASQGRHHSHEAHVEAGFTELFRQIRAAGCPLVAAVAGHDHDLQAYPPGCAVEDTPAILVSGVAGKGSRARESTHLDPCPLSGAASRYHAGPREAGGFILFEPSTEVGASQAVLWDAPVDGPMKELSRLNW